MVAKTLFTGVIALFFALSLFLVKRYWLSNDLLDAFWAGLAFDLALFAHRLYDKKFTA